MAPRLETSLPVARIVETDRDPLAVFDFFRLLGPALQILVLKLDHLGDFIIGEPSLRQLRRTFPSARIRLVVGSWNRAAAEASGMADEVVAYDFFPRAGAWNGQPHQPLEGFRAVTRGSFDLAVDLRVDEDTRGLLAEVDARLRCGIGSRLRHPFLDIALPHEHDVRATGAHLLGKPRFFEPDAFRSQAPFKRALRHETDFRPLEGHLIFGPDVQLPTGSLEARFHIGFAGVPIGFAKPNVTVDIARNGAEIVALRRFRGSELSSIGEDGVTLAFDNADAADLYEFRVHVEGKPLRGRLRFSGVRVSQVSAPPARFRQAELHIGEQLSLLVNLISQRALPLDTGVDPVSKGRRSDLSLPLNIAVAPFSNSDMRDWPARHFAALIRSFVETFDCAVTLLGSHDQKERLEGLADAVGEGGRIRVLAGAVPWIEMPGVVASMDLVICNNSGLAHLASAAGAPTISIYSGSHQPQEWGPRGPRSRALMSVVPCSPCGFDRLEECWNGHRCMVDLAPETVFAQALDLLARDPAAAER